MRRCVEVATESILLLDGGQGDAGGLIARATHEDADPVMQPRFLAEIEAEALLFAQLHMAGDFAPLEHAYFIGGVNQGRIDMVEPVLEIIVEQSRG